MKNDVFDGMRTIHRHAFEKKGIDSDLQLRRFFPRKYMDYRLPALLSCVQFHGEESVELAVPGTIVSIASKHKSGRPYTTVRATDRAGTPFSVIFMNQEYIANYIGAYAGYELLFMGAFSYSPIFGYSVFNPRWTDQVAQSLRVTPVYSKIKGVSEKVFQKAMEDVLHEPESDTLPSAAYQALGYPDINTAVGVMHNPAAPEDVYAVSGRLILDDLIYLDAVLEQNESSTETPVRLTKMTDTDAMIQSLPYKLTNDQANTIHDLAAKMSTGKTVRALIQGDVGCGKTIIAFSLMRCAAENGFQSIIMAPTQILAGQHYQALQELVPKDEIAFFSGVLKAKERKEMAARVASGEAKYIIGTSAILTSGIPMDNVGVTIVDEEHRFGVAQRNGVMPRKAHTIIMSATPIPRTLAGAAYGNDTLIYQIREKPAGRKEVKTYYDDGEKTDKFLYQQLKAGTQAYIVCPLKTEDMENDTDLESVESVYQHYANTFGKAGFPVCMVTGDTDPKEKDALFEDFRNGKYRILISTTVIEVGINVPNANVIIIKNAERFGLATLHQLRGRVGRGNAQGYCLLVSKDLANERLLAMCKTSDGFKIAEEDLKTRKSGDLIGLRQSGKNRFVEELIAFPNIAQNAKEILGKMTAEEKQKHIEKYQTLYGTAES